MVYETTKYGKDKRPVAEIWNNGMASRMDARILSIELTSVSR
jgi:hypothetical protein